MKTSIQTKLFIMLTTASLVFVAFSIFLTSFFLEDYYVLKNKTLFHSIASLAEEKYCSNPKQFTDYIEAVDREDNISIQVASPSGKILYSSLPQKKQASSPQLPKEIEEYIQNKMTGSSIYSIIEKEDKSLPKLGYIRTLNDGNLLVLLKSIKGIRESATISIHFSVISGAAIVILCALFVFYISRRITKPIIDMSTVAEGISNLDFDKKIILKRKDELGILADSINTIADKLKVSIDQMKKDIEFQKSLARNISHELKTPIGIIKGYTEGIMYGVADTKEVVDQYYGVIVSECNRMDEMVVEMLDLLALEAQDATLRNVDTFVITSVVDSIQERFEPIFRKEVIDFKCISEGNIVVTADYELLLRAISNIVMNAVKYNDERKYVCLCTKEEHGTLLISVYNTGPGLQEQEFEKIWDVFYKADKARTRNTGGHGLGLSIVKSIVALHGGTVWAENKEKGIEFYIALPISPEFRSDSL